MTNVKISDASLKQLRRFPYKERMIAEQIVRNEIIDKVRVASDACTMAAIIVMIEKFEFGTNVRREDSRIRQFMEYYQELMDYAAERYGDAMAEGLRKRLHDLGIDYESKEE